jgi:hypothetical protein
MMHPDKEEASFDPSKVPPLVLVLSVLDQVTQKAFGHGQRTALADGAHRVDSNIDRRGVIAMNEG